MSIKKTIEVFGISGEFIQRIERIDCIGKPNENRYAIVSGRIYATDAAKTANNAISSFSEDLRGAACEAVLASTDKDPFAAAYTEMKKPGGRFEGGQDC